MSFKDDLHKCNCKNNHTAEYDTELNENTYASDCVTKYKCRVCGKVFGNISDCVKHEYNCLQKQEEELKKAHRQREFEERKMKLATKKEELQTAKDEALIAWNNYIDKKNKEATIQKEINELTFGKNNYKTIEHLLDIFDI